MLRIVLVSVAVVAVSGTTAHAHIVQFSAVINGAQADECSGTGSGSTGTASFSLDTLELEVTYSIEYSALDGTENNAHVHFGAPCINGPIVYALPAGSPKNGIEFDLTAAEAQNMLDGLHYVNIHSDLHGGGEIRGQILQEPIPTVSTWGVATLVLLVLVAGTVVIRRRAAAHLA